MTYRYIASYNISEANQTTIINTLQLIDQVVIKKWADDFDRDALRTESICVIILDDGEETGLSHELSGNDNEWAYTFEHIPYSDNYSAAETGVRCTQGE